MSSSPFISSNSNLKTKPKPESPFSNPIYSRGGGDGGGGVRSVTVVDSKSCRQMYLRTAYTFTRQEDDNDHKYNGIDKAKKCLGRVIDRSVTLVYKRDQQYDLITKNSVRASNFKGMLINNKVHKFSCASILSMIRRMLSCTAKVDAVQH
ncbi:unnamed protein product [Amaranthus hypochondriacus]